MARGRAPSATEPASTAPQLFCYLSPIECSVRLLLVARSLHESESPILSLLAAMSKGCCDRDGKPCRSFFKTGRELRNALSLSSRARRKKISRQSALRVEKLFAQIRAPKLTLRTSKKHRELAATQKHRLRLSEKTAHTRYDGPTFENPQCDTFAAPAHFQHPRPAQFARPVRLRPTFAHAA